MNFSPPHKPVEQVERRLSPSSSSSSSVSSNGAYVVQAGKLITQGLEFESTGQLDESFDLFKAGVDVLLNGVQSQFIIVVILYWCKSSKCAHRKQFQLIPIGFLKLLLSLAKDHVL